MSFGWRRSLITGLAMACSMGAWAFKPGDVPARNFADEICAIKVDPMPRAREALIHKIVCHDSELAVVVPRNLVATRQLAERLNCMPALQWPEGARWSRVQVEPCRVRLSGVPVMVASFEAQGRAWVLDGSVSLLPVALSLAGISDLSEQERRALQDQLPQWWKSHVPIVAGSSQQRVRQALQEIHAANRRDDLEAAESLYRELLSLRTEMFGANSLSVGETLMELAINTSNQGRFEEAQVLFRRAEQLIEVPGVVYQKAQLKNYLAMHRANQREFGDALRLAQDAVRTWREMLDSSSKSGSSLQVLDRGGFLHARITSELAFATNLEAAMLLRVKQTALAYEKASDAFRLAAQAADFPMEWRADVLLTLGETAMALGRVAAAQAFFRSSQEIRSSLLGPSLPTIRTYITLARAFHSEGLHVASVSTYREAFGLMLGAVDVKAGFLSAQELQDFLSSAFALIADPATPSAQRVQLLQEVLFAAQMVRSGVVDKTITRISTALASSNGKMAQDIKALMLVDRQIASKRQDLVQLLNGKSEDRNPSAEAALMAEIRQLELKQRQAHASLLRSHPEYASLAQPQPLQVKTLQDRLSESEALVSFMVGDQESFALLIRKRAMHLSRIPLGREVLAGVVNTLRKSLQVSQGQLMPFDLNEAHDLYKVLLGPLESQLEGVDSLIVHPGASLASLPFAMLVTEPPADNAQRPYAQAAWLIKRMALSYVPSLQSFRALRDRTRAASPPLPFLGVGDPDLRGAGGATAAALDQLAGVCSPDAVVPQEMVRALAALPETNSEIRTIAGILAPHQKEPWLLREHATEAALRRKPLDQYRVLYFATHGLLPGELRCQSEPALVLSPPSKHHHGKSDDGLLQASEIAMLQLHADLVVLSACNTAGGEERFGGEALSGLAESFFFAGAKGLLVSHWQVPSAETEKLMVQMFKTAGQKFEVGPSLALQSSQRQLSLSEPTAHPFFWAAFTLIGDGRATQ